MKRPSSKQFFKPVSFRLKLKPQKSILMKRILLFTWICLLLAGINNISAQGADSLFAFYSFEETGTDSMGNVDLGFVDVKIVRDSLKGMVAEVVQDSSGYMYAMSTLMPEDQDEFTVSFWYFYEDNSGDWKQILEWANSKPAHPHYQKHFYMGPNLGGNSLGLVYYGNNWDYLVKEPKLPEKEWRHIAMTMKDTVVTVYLDGVEFFKDTATTMPSELAVDTFFFFNGGWPDGRKSPHDAKMDHLKIFHKALEPSTVAILAKEDEPWTHSLYAYYAFEESGVDSMGNVDLGFVDVKIVNDSLKGMVAEVVQDSSGYMYAMSPLMPDDQDEFTVSYWYFYENNSGDWKQILEWANSKPAHPHYQKHFYMGPNLGGNSLGLVYYGNNWDYIVKEPLLPEKEWRHLALTMKDTVVTVYLDGVEFLKDTTTTMPSDLAVDTFFFFNGGWPDGRKFPHDAKMDNLKIFHKALDSVAVAVLANEDRPDLVYIPPPPPAPDSLFAYYPFEESGVDSMGNVNLGMVDVEVVWDPVKGFVAEIVQDSSGYMYGMSALMPEDQDEYTVSCWYYYENNYGDWKQIFEFNNTKDPHPQKDSYYYLSPNLWGSNYGYISGGTSWEWISEEPILPDSTWYHLAVTQLDTVVTVYLNGEVYAESKVQLLPSEMAVDTFFFLNGGAGVGAAGADRNFPHYAKMDDLKFFHKALDAETVKKLSQENKPLKFIDKRKLYEKATVWFPLDGDGNDNIGDHILDLSDVTFVKEIERGGLVASLSHLDTSYMLAQQPLITEDVFTFATWFYWDSQYDEYWQEIFEWDNIDGTAHIYLSPRAGANYGLVTHPPWTATTDVKTLPHDKWIHLAFSYDEGYVIGYLDGAQAFQGETGSLLSELDLVKFYFGTSLEPGRIYRPISGKYDDIALWEEILTAEQIFAIANDTFPVRPDVDPYIIELEDYTFGDWSKGTDGDTSYGFWGGTSADVAMHDESILYGYANGGGTFKLWGRIKTDVDVANPLFLSWDGNDGFYTALDTVHPTMGWQWVQLFKTPSLPGGNHTIRIAPGAANFMIDKLIYTSDWGFDPNTEFEITDTEAPTDPGELLINNVDASSATMAWSASTDNVKVTTYDIYDGDRIVAISDVEALKLKLMASSDYSLSVRAKDQQGNVSGRNAAKDVTTEDLTITVKFDEPEQTIHHFGASDAWAIRWVANWPDAKRDSIAMLFFSQEMYPDGSPKGIGLSNWRYQIGEGSADMSDGGFHPDYWFREISSFMNADGTYDFTKQAESDWFKDRAIAAGVEYLTGWTTSPPPHMTKNGFPYRHDSTIGYNLAVDKYDDYGEYLAKIAKQFQDDGTPFEVISPINEPQWSWAFSHGNAVQSGSYATNSEVAAVAKAIDAKFTEFGVTAKILIPEAGMIDKLHSPDAGDPATSNQVYAFWDPTSPDYIGDLPNLSKYVAGHSYYSNPDVITTVANRKSLLDKINDVDSDLSFWQTEYSLLSGAFQDGRITLKPIEYSLWMARIIHIDVTEGGATGWDWWTALTRVPSPTMDYRYGLLSWYPEPDDASHTDGTFEVMPNLWALGNFSRFVRPGSKRLNVERSDGASIVGSAYDQFVSAYVDEDSTKIIIVAVNYNRNPQNLTFDVSNLPAHLLMDKLTPYITSESDNLKAYAKVDATAPFLMPGLSIVTLVGDLTNTTAIDDRGEKVLLEEASFKLYPNPAMDHAIVEFAGDPADAVKLIDMTGKILIYKSVTDGQVILNTSNLNRGFYIIAVEYGYKTEFQKLSIIE